MKIINYMVETQQQQQDQQQKNKDEKILVHDIPNDLLMNVVSELSIDSLVRFKFASKFWYNFIADPHFVKFHLDRSIAEKKLSLLLRTSTQKIYTIDSDAYSSAIEFVSEIEYDQSKLCDNYASSKVKVLGSCHGLLLMSMNENSTLSIFNPYTQESTKLPSRPYDEDQWYTMYGFGYDSDTDDYKVIQVRRIIVIDMEEYGLEAVVYSLKNNSWRMLDEFDDEDMFPFLYEVERGEDNHSIYVSGRVHWIGCEIDWGIKQYEWSIMTFDTGTEEFEEIEVPDYDEGVKMNAKLGVLKECLSMVYYYHRRNSTCIEIFLRKENGVLGEDPWHKLHSISGDVMNRSVRSGKSESWVILCYTEDGKMLALVDHAKLCLYDPETQIVQSLKLDHRLREILQDKGFYVMTYMPTLVPLGKMSLSSS